MINFLTKLLGGNKSTKDIKAIQPIVEKINEFCQNFAEISNDDLRNKTSYFKETIFKELEPLKTKMEELQEEFENLPNEDLERMEQIFTEIDQLKKEKLELLEQVLTEILPEAFAVIKTTAQRFSAKEEIISQATELDKNLAPFRQYITIKNGQSFYSNSWEAAGKEVKWDMVHYDVQLIGGIALHQGKIAEMATGEGKTLVSTLPAYLNALSGEGVHIVTVNDYLARRDSEWNGPILEWLGLTVDCIDKYEPHSEKRRQAYAADITYGTNNEFGFDFLRDNMVHHLSDKVQRQHHFAMVDEVDSVLIDDARTPLIISGPVNYASNEKQYFELKPKIEFIISAQKKIFQQSLQEAKRLINSGDDDPKNSGLFLYRAFRSLPKNGALIKFLSEGKNRLILQKAENYYLADQQKEMPLVDKEILFYIDEKNNSVELTDKGLQLISTTTNDPNFFTIPDLATQFAKIEQNTSITEKDKLQQKEQLMNDYSIKAERIHCVTQLLKAYTLFEVDIEYIVLNGQIKIIDEQTGRVLEGRRYSDGLHQALEAKENVKIEATTQTYATITLQNYFRMYHKLAGMTGTAETEAQEFWDIYKLDVMKIPTHLANIRDDKNDRIYKTKREKYKAIIDLIGQCQQKQQPILVGTTSVEVSELLSKLLTQNKIKHNVLNAKQHAREAQVIAEAGLKNAVTIATNMAGRGTDIKLGEGVKEIGGLAIIGSEKHESRRVDRQLRGRSGRQGDPGSTIFLLSLEDNLIRMFGGERITKVANFAGFKEGEVIEHKMITNAIERAQKKVEENNYGIRKRLLEYDDVMNKQRTVIYQKRNAALSGEKLKIEIDNAFYFIVSQTIAKHKIKNDYESFNIDCILNFEIDINDTLTKENFEKDDEETLTFNLYQSSINHYKSKKTNLISQTFTSIQELALKNPNLKDVVIPITNGKDIFNIPVSLKKTIASKGAALVQEIEKIVFLHFIDDSWKEHLRLMDDLKHSVQTASYEQKDPLVIYKLEAFELFNKFNIHLSSLLVQFLCHLELYIPNVTKPYNTANVNKKSEPKLKEVKSDFNSSLETNSEPKEKPEPIKAAPKVGRNELCPCGSGKKYKNCHFNS